MKLITTITATEEQMLIVANFYGYNSETDDLTTFCEEKLKEIMIQAISLPTQAYINTNIEIARNEQMEQLKNGLAQIVEVSIISE